MENEHVLGGLVRKRKELSRQLDVAQDQLRKLTLDLDNIEAAIKVFDPEYPLEEIKPRPLPPRHPAFKGQVSRAIFNVLRNADKPMTAMELAKHLMAERNLDAKNRKLYQLMRKRVSAALRHYKSKGVIEADENIGRFLRWRLA